jgi:hypothetical protein
MIMKYVDLSFCLAVVLYNIINYQHDKTLYYQSNYMIKYNIVNLTT